MVFTIWEQNLSKGEVRRNISAESEPEVYEQYNLSHYITISTDNSHRRGTTLLLIPPSRNSFGSPQSYTVLSINMGGLNPSGNDLDHT